jgi:hypothetical protein
MDDQHARLAVSGATGVEIWRNSRVLLVSAEYVLYQELYLSSLLSP